LDPLTTYTFVIRFRIPTGGSISLRGFGLDVGGKVLLPTPKLIIEWLGDSISAAFFARNTLEAGNFIVETCRQLNVTNCPMLAKGGVNVATMNAAYHKIGPEPNFPTLPPWKFNRLKYRPRVVISVLGTNNMRASRRDPAGFVRDYVTLLQKVRRTYGKTTRLVIVTPFGYWTGTIVFPNIDLALLRRVEAQLGPRTYLIDTAAWLSPANAPQMMGDVVHPTSDGHVYLGGRLAAALKGLGLFDDPKQLG
jgi:hypothetical protein